MSGSPRLFVLAGLALTVAAAAALVVTADAAAGGAATDRLFGLWRFRHVAVAVLLAMTALGAFAVAAGRDAAMGYVVIVGTVLLFGAVLEGAGRLGLVDWTALLGGSRSSDPGPGWTRVANQDIRGETYQDIAVRLRLPSDPIGFEYRTDAYGFRNDSAAPAEVIVLGDSVVLGAAVPVAETVAPLLSRRLDRPVMQAALLGLSVQGQHDMLAEAGVPLDGRTVIQFVFEGNDLLDSRAYRSRNEGTETAEGTRSLVRLAWGALVSRSSDPTIDHVCRIDGRDYAFLWTRRSFAGLEGEFDHIAQAIAGFAGRVEEAGGTYVLVFVPTKYRVLHDLCNFPDESALADSNANLSGLPGELADWSGASGIPMLDLTAPLVEAAQAGSIPWFWGDTHWNADGHRVAADAIAGWDALAR